MKTILKNTLVFSLSLCLFFFGCGEKEPIDPGVDPTTPPTPPTTDVRDKVVKTYDVVVTIPERDCDLQAQLKIEKAGENNLKATASVNVPDLGTLAIDLLLTSLTAHTGSWNDIPADGFHYKITQQQLTLGEIGAVHFAGTGTHDGGHDGIIYKLDSEETPAHIAFEIMSEPIEEVGILTLNVVSGTIEDPGEDDRDAVIGTKEVVVFVSPIEVKIPAEVQVAKEGVSDLRVSTSISIDLVGNLDLDLILSSLEVQQGEIKEAAAKGFAYKITTQTLNIEGLGSINVAGTGSYDNGYDGIILANTTDSFISFEIGGSIAGYNLVIKVETPGEDIVDPDDFRNPVVGEYDVNVIVGSNKIPVTLTVDKEGTDNLKASIAAVALPGIGDIAMDVVLSDLQAYSGMLNNEQASGFYYRIATQSVSMLSFSGTGQYNGGYDGGVFNLTGTEATSFISFEIGTNVGITVKVETRGAEDPGDPDDPDDPDDPQPPAVNRSEMIGTYNVAINFMGYDLLPTNLTVVTEGSSNLKATTTIVIPDALKEYLPLPISSLPLEIVFSSLSAFGRTYEDGHAAGFYYKIASQTMGFSSYTVNLQGSGKFKQGNDGEIYKLKTNDNKTIPHLSFEVNASPSIFPISIPIFIKSIAQEDEPDPDAPITRDEVVGNYPAKVYMGSTPMSTTLIISKSGGNGLNATTVFSIPLLGSITLGIEMSNLTTGTITAGTVKTNYFACQIEPQTVPVSITTVNLQGTNNYLGNTADGWIGKRIDTATQEAAVFAEYEVTGTIPIVGLVTFRIVTD